MDNKEVSLILLCLYTYHMQIVQFQGQLFLRIDCLVLIVEAFLLKLMYRGVVNTHFIAMNFQIFL